MSRDFEDWDNRTPHVSPYDVRRGFLAAERRQRLRIWALRMIEILLAAAVAGGTIWYVTH